MENDFLANVPAEDEVIKESPAEKTDESAKETPTAPPAETKPEPAKPPQGGEHTPDENNLPFHKHPRWIKTQEELAELRKYRDDTKPRLETYEQMMSRLGNQNQPKAQIPEWFPKSGNQQVDEQKYQEYLNYENGVKAQIKQELIEEQTREARQKAAEEKKWADWVNTSLEKLEDEGHKFDRNELQKVALEYLPTDLEGNIDFSKALKIMNQLKAQQVAVAEVKSDARKKLADTANASTQRAEKPPQKFQTTRSLRNQSWDALIRE